MEKGARLPTKDEINALVSYLPRLYTQGFEPVVKWEGGEKNDKRAIQTPYPIYDPLVEEFMRTAAGECWLDTGYDPEEAHEMLNNDHIIASADLPRIRSMLTFIIRGERFSDGHWEEMITRGYVRKLLERLAELGK